MKTLNIGELEVIARNNREERVLNKLDLLLCNTRFLIKKEEGHEVFTYRTKKEIINSRLDEIVQILNICHLLEMTKFEVVATWYEAMATWHDTPVSEPSFEIFNANEEDEFETYYDSNLDTVEYR